MKTGNKLFRNLLLLLGILVMGVDASAQSLAVTAAAVEPGSVEPGEGITVIATITNNAPVTTPAGGNNLPAGTTITATVTFTNVETGTSFTGTASGVTTEAIDEAGGSGTADLSGMTVPLSTSDVGDHRITVVMTAPNASTFSARDGVLAIEGKPDLRITGMTYPAGISYEGGDTIPMSITYTNQISSDGNANVPYVPGYINANNFRIRIVLSSNPTFGDADDFDLTVHDIGSRVNADGVGRTLNWTQLLPGNYTGSYFVLAKIDVNEQVDESVEDDLRQNGNNIWYGGAPTAGEEGSVGGTRIALDPTNFPTIYWGSTSSDNWSDLPVASEDGRYTVYASDATTLVDEDTNSRRDVFVYDQQTSTIRRLSISQQQGNGPSTSPFISGDASSTAFTSEATNLILGDTNGFSDVFVTATFEDGGITRVSESTAGIQSNGSSFRPSLSYNGRWVVFESTANNLVSAGTLSGTTHIYLRDTQTNVTSLISRDSAGTAGDDDSTQARISADGRYVVFASNSTNLVSGDTNAQRDIFRHDTQTGTTIRVSVANGGTESNGFSRSPSVSEDGGFVAFHSSASNLISGDSNGVNDIFIHTVASGTTTRVSVASDGTEASDPSSTNFQLGSINPSISATGRYVAFASLANNLTDGDSIGQYSATDNNQALDIFVHDRDVSGSGAFDTAGNLATTMVSRNRFGMQTVRVLGVPSSAASDIFPAISSDGRWVAFPSDAAGASGLTHTTTNRLSADTNDFRDIFIHDRRTNALPKPGSTPSVTVISPSDGSTVQLGVATTVTASALTPIGTIASVEIFEGSSSLGTVTTPPYSVQWTPTVEGVYTLSALVIDSFSNQSLSESVVVAVSTEAVPVEEGEFHTGSYIEGLETGTVTLVKGSNGATFISAKSDGSDVRTYTNVPVDDIGNFSVVQDGTTVLSGKFLGGAATGVFGNGARFVSSTVSASADYTGNTGTVYGSVISKPNSEALFVFAPDGRLLVILNDGSISEVADGRSSNSGVLSGTTSSGGRLSGNFDAATGFLTARISGGSISGNLTGALALDTPPSNGVMFNLSTRGNIGAGDNVLVAGFVVSGDVSKQLLVRALGPTIGAAPYNVPGVIADPTLTVYDSASNVVASNDNWSSDPNVSSASSSAGAFTLPNGSLDSALVATLVPGAYTATVSGVGGASGVGLVELYDVIQPSAFSDDKLTNVSTRGRVGSGSEVLIAGVIINGTTPKRMLIRAVGPTLSTFGVSSSLADPVLKLVRQETGLVVRENGDWEKGNDATEMVRVAAEVGATALPSGSKDSAILITLPPGVYTAIVDTGDGSEGIALVEVYEVP